MMMFSRSILRTSTLAIGLCIATAIVNGQKEGSAVAVSGNPTEGSGLVGVAVDRPSNRPFVVKDVRRPVAYAKKSTPAKSRKIRQKNTEYDGFIVGDDHNFMNFAVVSAPKLIYPPEAKAKNITGYVMVDVLVDTNGRVLEAKASSGNPILHAEAVKAARSSVFEPGKFGGKPARMIGFLVYRFGSDDPTANKPLRRCSPVFDFKNNKGRNGINCDPEPGSKIEQ